MTRVRASEVVEMTGLTLRTVQSLALRGKIPGAAKLGSTWTFDKTKVASWISRQEGACQTISIRETASGMPAFKFVATTSANRYRQEIAERRRRA